MIEILVQSLMHLRLISVENVVNMTDWYMYINCCYRVCIEQFTYSGKKTLLYNCMLMFGGPRAITLGGLQPLQLRVLSLPFVESRLKLGNQ